jgi:TIR domain
MATLRQYFDTDFNRVLSVHDTWELTGPDRAIRVIVRVHHDFDANAKFVSCFVPSCENSGSASAAILNKCEEILGIDSGVIVQMGHTHLEETIDSRELRFTGRVFVYSESEIPDLDARHLIETGTGNGLAIRIRGPRYAMAKSKVERPVAFISHDSRDKDAVARPIAVGLSKLMCPVWFDEFSLKVGDSLRESIEKGLKECRKCVLVLSPRFLANPGWTKVEFNSIFTREVIEKQNLVLPVWFETTKEAIFDYCPTLVDRVGLDWNLGEEEVVRRLYRALT